MCAHVWTLCKCVCLNIHPYIPVLGAVNCLVLCVEAFYQSSFVLRCYRAWGGSLVLVLHLSPCSSTGCRLHFHQWLRRWETALCKKVQGVRVGTTLTMSQQGALAANSLWGCVRQSFASCSRPGLQGCAHFWAPQFGRRGCSAGGSAKGHHSHQVLGAPVEWGEAEQAGTVQCREEKFWGFCLCKGETDSFQG